MGKNSLRKQRKKNEADGLFHVHLDGATHEDYISSCDFEKKLSSFQHEIRDSSFFSDPSPATSPRYERMRLQITAVLAISCIFGLFAFVVTMAVWIYNAIYYPLLLSDGLKSILGLMAVEGQALACTSLTGYEIYRKQFTGRPALVFYNSVAALVVILLTLACRTQPDVNEMVDTITFVMNNLRSKMNRQFPGGEQNWCCSYHGYKPICNESSDGLMNKIMTGNDVEAQETQYWGLSNITVHSSENFSVQPTADNSSDDWTERSVQTALRKKLDSLCGRLYGWSMADTVIKSMSHYMIPAFMCISLMATLLHLSTCTKVQEIHSPPCSEDSVESKIADEQPV